MPPGKIAVVFAVSSLFILPLLATGATVDKFQGGTEEAVADLSGSVHSAIMNITIPADCYVLNATMEVTGVAKQGVYPVAPEVSLDNTTLWAFEGTGYGSLGMQDQFSNGSTQIKFPFGPSGGMKNTTIRLPSGALIQNATLDVNVSGPIAKWPDLVDIAAAPGDRIGISVSNAGDVNDDGYDDIIVGAPYNDSGGIDAGRAYIYYGGQTMDNIPDMTLSGAAADDLFGSSVSSAGDVNNDGYDDVIVGAYCAMDFTGRAYIYYGGPLMYDTPNITLSGTAAYDYFGISVSGAGDVNNDGYNDVIVGAYENDTDAYRNAPDYIPGTPP